MCKRHGTVQKHQLRDYRWPGLLLQTAFCQSCKAVLVHYRSCWVLIRIVCVPDCCKWPSQSIQWFVYIPVTYREHSTTVCGLMTGRAHLQLPAHPHHPQPLPPIHPFINDTHDITGIVKKLSQKPAVNTAWQNCYETLAISLFYLYGKSCMAIMQHRGTTAASMFQNCISRNTKCDNFVGFS